MAPGGVVGDDDDETTIEVDADNDENDNAMRPTKINRS